MQSLEQNKQVIYYALYNGSEDETDASGHKTGGKVKTYKTPVRFRANVSAARGSVETEQFGINDDYERTISTNDLSCPIKEDSVLWLGIYPASGVKHNYKVVRVARSINSIIYAIKKVTVS